MSGKDLPNSALIKRSPTSIRELVSRLDKEGTLKDHPFYFMAFTNLFAVPYEHVIPREMAIVEYTLNGGLLKEYTDFVKVEAIPYGQHSKANLATAVYHGIPSFEFSLENGNFNKMGQNIFKMMDSELYEDFPIMFCEKELIEDNVRSLNYILERAGMTDRQWKFEDITQLITALSAISKCGASRVDFDRAIKRSMFDYCENTRCRYHEEIDNPNCSLAKVKKCTYCLSEIVLPFLSIEVTINHIPLFEGNACYSIFNQKYNSKPTILIGKVSSTTDSKENQYLNKTMKTCETGISSKPAPLSYQPTTRLTEVIQTPKPDSIFIKIDSAVYLINEQTPISMMPKDEDHNLSHISSIEFSRMPNRRAYLEESDISIDEREFSNLSYPPSLQEFNNSQTIRNSSMKEISYNNKEF